MENKTFSLFLPVFKQGDDLANSIQDTTNLEQAFKLQAEKYKSAAEICLKLSNVMKNNEQYITVDAQTHSIMITGPEEIFKSLIEDETLSEEEFEDDIDEEE